MFRKTLTGCLIATSIFIVSPTSASAEGVSVIEDFESYSTGVGNWTVSDTSGVSVNLGLNLTSPIQGIKDLKQTATASNGNNRFTVQNLSLNVPIPAQAEDFSFSLKAAPSTSVNRTVRPALITSAGTHESHSRSLAHLADGAAHDFDVSLKSFSPPLPAGAIITGVQLEFRSGSLNDGLEEQLDYLRFTWDNSSVDEWTLY